MQCFYIWYAATFRRPACRATEIFSLLQLPQKLAGYAVRCRIVGLETEKLFI